MQLLDLSKLLYMYFSELILGFVKVDAWICLSCSMYFSPLAKQNQAEVDTWISLSCYMDLSKLILGFVKVDTWICQS